MRQSPRLHNIDYQTRGFYVGRYMFYSITSLPGVYSGYSDGARTDHIIVLASQGVDEPEGV